MAHAHLVALDLVLIALVAGREPLLGLRVLLIVEVKAIAVFRRTVLIQRALKRRADQIDDRPHALDVGIAPRGQRLLPGGTVGLRGRRRCARAGRRRARLAARRERRGGSNQSQRENSLSHLRPPSPSLAELADGVRSIGSLLLMSATHRAATFRAALPQRPREYTLTVPHAETVVGSRPRHSSKVKPIAIARRLADGDRGGPEVYRT
jgi:hypothetical protein